MLSGEANPIVLSSKQIKTGSIIVVYQQLYGKKGYFDNIIKIGENISKTPFENLNDQYVEDKLPFDEKGKTEIGKAAVCSVGIMFGAAFLTGASFEATAMVKGMGFKGAMSTPVTQEAAKGLIEGLTVATGPPSNAIGVGVNIGKDIMGFCFGE